MIRIMSGLGIRGSEKELPIYNFVILENRNSALKQYM